MVFLLEKMCATAHSTSRLSKSWTPNPIVVQAARGFVDAFVNFAMQDRVRYGAVYVWCVAQMVC